MHDWRKKIQVSDGNELKTKTNTRKKKSNIQNCSILIWILIHISPYNRSIHIAKTPIEWQDVNWFFCLMQMELIKFVNWVWLQHSKWWNLLSCLSHVNAVVLNVQSFAYVYESNREFVLIHLLNRFLFSRRTVKIKRSEQKKNCFSFKLPMK